MGLNILGSNRLCLSGKFYTCSEVSPAACHVGVEGGEKALAPPLPTSRPNLPEGKKQGKFQKCQTIIESPRNHLPKLCWFGNIVQFATFFSK